MKRPTPIVVAELAVMIFACLLAAAGAVLTAIEGPAQDPLDDPPHPSHR